MMNVILKILGWAALAVAALAAWVYWDKKSTPDYIEIYSDDDEEF